MWRISSQRGPTSQTWQAHLLSWTDYGVSQGASWNPVPAQQEAWARTYARAIAGQPLNMSFDPTTKRFEFCYTPDPSITAPTEIFASRHYSYTSGMDVTSTPNLRAVAAASSDVVLVTPSPPSSSSSSHAAAAVGCVWIRRPTAVV